MRRWPPSVQHACPMTTAPARTLAVLRVDELTCSPSIPWRTAAFARRKLARPAAAAVVQARGRRQRKRLTPRARPARMTLADTLARVKQAAAVLVVALDLLAAASLRHTDRDASAVPSTAMCTACERRRRTLDALPAGSALAKAVDALAVAIAVGRAACRRELACRPRKAGNAHARRAAAVPTTGAAERALVTTTAW